MNPMSNQEQCIIDQAIAILRQRLMNGDVFDSPEVVKQFAQLNIAGDLDEGFYVLFLTSQHQLITFEKMFSGTINASSVYPRVIARRCLEVNAASVIISHNHPSGISEPSNADINITNSKAKALSLLDVKLLDHIVVSVGSTVSLAERGII